MQELYAIVQMIKGQGSSFGYPLISNVGAQLARFMEDCGDNLTDAQMEGVKVHVETLRLIMQQKMEGDGGPMGQKIVAGLALVIKKNDRRHRTSAGVARSAARPTPSSFTRRVEDPAL